MYCGKWRRRLLRSAVVFASGAADDDQLVGGGLCAPDLAGPAEALANVRGIVGQRERLELFGFGVETQHCVCAEVAHPDAILVVDVDGVRVRL